MTNIREVSLKEHSEKLSEITDDLMDVLEDFANRHGLSVLSAATLAFQALAMGLREIGGLAGKQYMGNLIDGLFCTDDKEGRKINQRGRRAMEQMAERYDLMAAKPEGRTQ